MIKVKFFRATHEDIEQELNDFFNGLDSDCFISITHTPSNGIDNVILVYYG